MPKHVKTSLFYKLYLNIISSIGLVPAIISIVLLALSLFTLNIDQESPDLIVPKASPGKNIIYPDSALYLLSTIAGGMITLMVFTFTMVMVVLNQTASNYSPRVLPTLIKRRFHQVTMGIYLGTIAYTFMVLISIKSEIYQFDVPFLSVIIAAFLSLVCLALFIIFIQSISQNIQVGEIINRAYQDTLKSLDREIHKNNCAQEDQLPDTHQWEILHSPIAGYLDSINSTSLIKKLRSMDITIKMLVVIGRYVNQKDAFFYVSRRLSDTEQEEIFQAFVFRHQEIVKQNYIYGFKQLAEIAVKALSPGINDPGTAIQAIDRLTDLFVKSLELSGFPTLTDKDKKLRLIYQPASLEDIFYLCFSSIKNYAGSNVPVILKLLLMIKTIAQNDQEGKLTNLLLTSVNDAIEQFVPDFRSTGDKQRFIQSIEKVSLLYADHPGMKEILQQLNSLKESFNKGYASSSFPSI